MTQVTTDKITTPVAVQPSTPDDDGAVKTMIDLLRQQQPPAPIAPKALTAAQVRAILPAMTLAQVNSEIEHFRTLERDLHAAGRDDHGRPTDKVGDLTAQTVFVKMLSDLEARKAQIGVVKK